MLGHLFIVSSVSVYAVYACGDFLEPLHRPGVEVWDSPRAVALVAYAAQRGAFLFRIRQLLDALKVSRPLVAQDLCFVLFDGYVHWKLMRVSELELVTDDVADKDAQ